MFTISVMGVVISVGGRKISMSSKMKIHSNTIARHNEVQLSERDTTLWVHLILFVLSDSKLLGIL